MRKYRRDAIAFGEGWITSPQKINSELTGKIRSQACQITQVRLKWSSKRGLWGLVPSIKLKYLQSACRQLGVLFRLLLISRDHSWEERLDEEQRREDKLDLLCNMSNYISYHYDFLTGVATPHFYLPLYHSSFSGGQLHPRTLKRRGWWET